MLILPSLAEIKLLRGMKRVKNIVVHCRQPLHTTSRGIGCVPLIDAFGFHTFHQLRDIIDIIDIILINCIKKILLNDMDAIR